MSQRSRSDSGRRRHRETGDLQQLGGLWINHKTYEEFKALAYRSNMSLTLALELVMAQAVADAGPDGRLRIELVR